MSKYSKVKREIVQNFKALYKMFVCINMKEKIVNDDDVGCR